jgi:hypothetical protein
MGLAILLDKCKPVIAPKPSALNFYAISFCRILGVFALPQTCVLVHIELLVPHVLHALDEGTPASVTTTPAGSKPSRTMAGGATLTNATAGMPLRRRLMVPVPSTYSVSTAAVMKRVAPSCDFETTGEAKTGPTSAAFSAFTRARGSFRACSPKVSGTRLCRATSGCAVNAHPADDLGVDDDGVLIGVHETVLAGGRCEFSRVVEVILALARKRARPRRQQLDLYPEHLPRPGRDVRLY